MYSQGRTFVHNGVYMDQVTKLRLSWYPALLSIDSKTRQQDSSEIFNTEPTIIALKRVISF